MSCNSCKSGSSELPRGCNNNGNCSSGSCGTFTVFDWLSDISNSKINPFKIVEVRFKNGRKGYYRNNELNVSIGDTIIIESEKGYDIGTITLTGELVRIQLKKKGINIDDELFSLKRYPNEKEISKWQELMRKESEIQVRARIIAIDLGLKMKISDVEFQADGSKAIFYYTADQRVDFRELIKFSDQVRDLQGSYQKSLLEIEKINGHDKSFRRSIYLNKYLPKGATIKPEDVVILRPLSGIPASQYYELIGKKLARDINGLEILQWSDILND